MLVPNKYMNFKISIVNIASTIIEILMKNGICHYTEVLNLVKQKHGEASKYEFQNSLNFLYLIGKIKYYLKDDALELIV